MKRSEINAIISDGIKFLDNMRFHLPPYAYWNLDKWNEHVDEAENMRSRGIGWDIIDFNKNNFRKWGLLLFTLSNGIMKNNKFLDQSYSNKILIICENQITLTHHHWTKIEDIINHGDGVLEVEVHNVGPDDTLDTVSDVRIYFNNIRRTVKPGTVLALEPGDRIRLDTNHWHKFWARHGKGQVLAMEVSSVNDDNTDNCFLPEDKNHVKRFPEIEENEYPNYLLCNELPGTKKFEDLKAKFLTEPRL